jgi:sulfur-oxidizing protein SoxY
MGARQELVSGQGVEASLAGTAGICILVLESQGASMQRPILRIVLVLALAMLATPDPAPAGAARGATAEQPSEAWEALRPSLFGARPILDGAKMIALDAPYRAEDAAIVPVGISIDPGPERRVVGLSLIIDENPVPVAAEFRFGEGMGREIDFAVRVRVNAYSNVRAVAELDDGALLQHALFVKASGGCSAPALKDADAAMASLGEIRLRRFPVATADASADLRAEAQVMVRHPNASGFQLDPVTNLYVPALYVDDLTVRQGDALLFRMTGGISISEDPTVRFRYVPDPAANLAVSATDTDGHRFSAAFPADGS